jgi:hypothetical protein
MILLWTKMLFQKVDTYSPYHIQVKSGSLVPLLFHLTSQIFYYIKLYFDHSLLKVFNEPEL